MGQNNKKLSKKARLVWINEEELLAYHRTIEAAAIKIKELEWMLEHFSKTTEQALDAVKHHQTLLELIKQGKIKL